MTSPSNGIESNLRLRGGSDLGSIFSSLHGPDRDDLSIPSGSTGSRTKPTKTFLGASNEINKPIDGEQGTMGTINGVFLPCVQNILGVILFLRLPSITAQAGCVYTTIIIGLCMTSSLLTALSLSAIATNGKIRAGGPYYVISRTLGLEIGGALGILFYLGTTCASSMYVLGAVEALQSTVVANWHVSNFGHTFTFDTQLASLGVMFSLTFIVSVGMKYVNMCSGISLVITFISIISFTLGATLFAMGIYNGRLTNADRVYFDNMWPNVTPDPTTEITPTFFSLVALFYPSATGIMAGCNRSAFLKAPGKSIPRGTIGAILTTTFMYLSVVWLFGTTVANVTLKTNKLIVSAIAFPQGQIVKVGIIFSCLGAAMQCLAGASQLLAAIAADESIAALGVFKPLRNSPNSNRAIWFTWFIASVPTLSGNLDFISPIIAMFFLLMYSGINLSCFFLGVLHAPGFRPTFRFSHWSVSLIGFFWCIGLAFYINLFAALASISLFFFLYLVNKKQIAEKDWGDVWNSLRYAVVTHFLRELTGTTTGDFHAKNWRPQLLTIVDCDQFNTPTNTHTLSLAAQLNKGRGINMVVSILQKDQSFESYDTVEMVESSRAQLRKQMNRIKMEGFEEVFVTTRSRSEAIWSAVIHSGLGPLSANTVITSFPKNWRDQHEDVSGEYIQTLKGIMNLKKSLLVFRGNERYPSSPHVSMNDGVIDVWWVVHDGGLLLLLPYLLSQNDVWRKSKLRLFAVTSSSTENPESLYEAVVDHLTRVRISATVTVVDLSNTGIAIDLRELEIARRQSIQPETNTQHLTVGEVFSKEVYEIPYSAVTDEETGNATHDYDGSVPLDDSQEARRIRTAMAFNEAVQRHSLKADLVVMNMPLIRPGKPASDFLEYVDLMFSGIGNALLVRGTGTEVITTYA